jgi:transposase-like protein
MELEEFEVCNSVSKQDRRGRRVARAEERERLLGLYDRSGLTQERFCEEHGVNVHTFVAWLGKRRNGAGVKAMKPLKFQELVLSGPTSGEMLEVILPDGTTLKSGNAKLVVEVLKELRGLC